MRKGRNRHGMSARADQASQSYPAAAHSSIKVSIHSSSTSRTRMCYALFTEPKGPETSQGTPLVEHPDTEQLVLSAASRAASPSQRWTFGTTLAGGSLHSRDHHVAGGPPTWAIIALQSRSEAGENGDATEIRPSVKFGLAVSMSLIEPSPRQGPTKRSNDREPTETGSQRGAAQDPHIPRARDALPPVPPVL